jgi:hypothetical protein
VFAGAVTELRFLHAEGQVTQRWYRDGDLPTGSEIADLPYQLESTQLDLGLSIGLTF